MLLTKKQIQKLLEPISDEFPCGSYLKEVDNNAYRLLRNEFNLAQIALRKLSQNPDMADIDSLKDECRGKWSLLSDHLFDIFHTKTKDTELISWFICSQLILDNSLESVANSLSWLSDLAEKEWATLNPVLHQGISWDDEESEKAKRMHLVKIKAFSQLSGDSETSGLLYAPLLFQPLVSDITFFNYKSAEHKGKLNELKLSAAPFVDQERVAIHTRLENVARCLVSIEQLTRFVAEQSSIPKNVMPNFGFLKKIFSMLENALIFLSGFSKLKSDTEVVKHVELGENQQHSHSPLLSNSILHRDVAFHHLREIADYFYKSEPHSPISYLLEKAIYWGYLALPDLLREILAEQTDDAIAKIFNNAGLNQQKRAVLPNLSEAQNQSFFEINGISLNNKSDSFAENEISKNSEEKSTEKSLQSITTTALNW